MQDTELPEKIEPTSLNFQTELASQLAKLVPEAMSDGKLDVTKLREMINGDAENSLEKFGLFWPGKRAAQALAQIPTTATLIPVPEESEDWDSTKNIFIEGDNLEVLKALQNSYRRKVKMIYIDPPYNTGKEFIYPDKFSEGLQGYLEYTGQKNEAGENVESKPETGGRRHSNWLSMMYPRLQLAKSLLTDDGVIFMSIDDNEQSNLKKLCDEVFGEDNFISVLSVASNSSKNNSKLISVSHEYVLAYARKIESLVDNWKVKKNNYAEFTNRAKQLTSRNLSENEIHNELLELVKYPRFYDFDHYTFADKNGVYQTDNPGGVSNGNTSTVVYHPTTKKQCAMPNGGWRYKEDEINRMVSDGEFVFGKDESTVPRVKRYLHDYLDQTPKSTLFFDSQSSTKWLKNNNLPFDFPKAVEFISYLVSIPTSKNDVVLDFFAGSGTTGHAVMQLNAIDGGARAHIQVQLPELTDLRSDAYKAGFSTIADISKERLRRAGKKVREDYVDKVAQRSTPLDTGFRVYKLAPSNFVQWDEGKAKDDIQQSVLDFAANKKPDAAPESLLTEIMLQARMPLSANIEKRDLQSGGWVFVVDGGNLIAYVANEQITEAQANEIADLAPAKLIVLDSAFNGNNALKINVANICKEKFIKEFKTI